MFARLNVSQPLKFCGEAFPSLYGASGVRMMLTYQLHRSLLLSTNQWGAPSVDCLARDPEELRQVGFGYETWCVGAIAYLWILRGGEYSWMLFRSRLDVEYSQPQFHIEKVEILG